MGGGNKYFGMNFSLKDNVLISGSTKRLCNTHPIQVYGMLWHNFPKILYAFIRAINASQIACCFLRVKLK